MNFFRTKQPRVVREKERMVERKKVAIIGTGCSGLGAAWALRDSDYDVHLFEKSDELGGHTSTKLWQHGEKEVPVDTGFIVLNKATYPNFIRFLKEVGVETVETEMTFGVSRDHGAFEWSGEGRGIFAQRRNIFRPRHWRMIFDIIRFNQFALDLLADEDASGLERLGSSPEHRKRSADISIGEYLDREGYSQGFRDDYLIPMTAAVWSTSPDKASLEFPARTLIRFMWNHHLLSTLAERPPWLTIPGGSKRYIDAIVSQYPRGKLHVHTSCEVANVLRQSKHGEGKVTVSWINSASGRIEGDTFDHAILACHGDEVLPLLSKHGARPQTSSPASSIRSNKSSKSFVKASSSAQNVTEEEYDIFSAFQTTENICYLHSDLAQMPKRRKVWTSWNYLISSTPSKLASPAGVSLTYCMNILQHLSEEIYGPILVTMNPDREPNPALTQGKYVRRHPLYTVESVQAQKDLEKVQNVRGVSYCGAWTKYGFHEDGFSSGIRVAAEHLGAKLPFEFVDSTFSRGHRPDLCYKDYLLRVVLLVSLFYIRILEIVLRLPFVSPFVAIVSLIVGSTLDLSERAGLL
ncbi:unnamed protein product [Zymoseptoria tritici ST99CH_1A5]|uniref:Amine oxidase domain-containing protein n=3 Tax=Zymoseptoria tritici TaxID=1047171 RepID=A0A1X7RDU9_ZYMT9|nr:unnamed protein product [Zymoseptoria tritici ST99CH_3D7]SMR41944.1 unnamed protein product [Zymoseptoria tritici ST99CH_1E4]SMR44133.1 unnamed protein product [Zymoseptoria tritici ST99CH_3D1]SMY19289.1 unnamed protein product [Zymoseptoria tritici ST99CH_1A5]